MYINEKKRAIEMNAVEYKAAMTAGTEEYKTLHETLRDYPGFRTSVNKVKKPKADFSDLKMKDIIVYVAKHGSEEQKAHFAFITKRSVTEDGEYCEPQSFFEIKSWFLNEFPEIRKARMDYRIKIQEIYASAAAKAEMAEVA